MEIYFYRLIIVLALAGVGLCATFTVYEDSGRTSTPTFLVWGGGASQQFTVSGSTCMNFNFYNDKISSIDPHGGCVKVWEHGGCSGASMIVTEASGCSKNLAACDITNQIVSDGERRRTWDNQISSVSICTSAEEAEANQPFDNGDMVEHDMLSVNSNDAKLASGDLLINAISFFQHRNNYFSVRLCKHTDCKRQERIHAQAGKDSCANFGATWDRQVSAVYTLFDCVEMFDGRDCTGESIKFKKSVYWWSGPQLNPCRSDLTTCKLENGQSWSWNDRIRSMRRCSN